MIDKYVVPYDYNCILNCDLHLQPKLDKYLDKRRAVSQVEYHLGHMQGRRRHLNNLFERWNSGFQVEDDYQTFVKSAKEVWNGVVFFVTCAVVLVIVLTFTYLRMFACIHGNLPHTLLATLLHNWSQCHTVETL